MDENEISSISGDSDISNSMKRKFVPALPPENAVFLLSILLKSRQPEKGKNQNFIKKNNNKIF